VIQAKQFLKSEVLVISDDCHRCLLIFESLLWGIVASIPLIIDCLVALFVNLPKSIIAVLMGFGSAVLI